MLVKSGEKDAEKRFLGYEFSNRRGSEGIHPIQRGKNIEDCTQLFDAEVFDNPTKASTYIYKAFQGDFDFEIDSFALLFLVFLSFLYKSISFFEIFDFDRDTEDFRYDVSLML